MSHSSMKLLQIDELLYNVLFKEDLLQFAPVLAKNTLTRADHFSQVTDQELQSFGLPTPAIRRLRNGLALKEIKKRMEKRAKKNLPINYINVSHLDVPSPTKQQPQSQPQQQQHQVPQQEQPKEVIMREMAKEEKPSTSNNPLPLALILKEDIHLMESLGEGTFAVVKRGLWKRNEGEKKVDVAVKILREVTDIVKKDLEAEIQTMSKLHHAHLVDLYGVVLGDPMLMVLEFCEGGSLLNRLRSSEKPVLLATQLLNYALQMASGMSYLQQKGYVHRDLATRNVLLKDTDEKVKICDFGLSRLVNEYDRTYDMQGVTKVPFSWCPPEALRFRKFSSASDVWAFGVTIWECFTFGEEPWIGLNALAVLQTTERGERLHKPDKASQELYDLMQKCWSMDPTNRPDFPYLYAILTKIKFQTRICIKDHRPTIPAEISINKGDKFIVLEETTPNTLLGQNVTSRAFGHCPKIIFSSEVSTSPVPFQPREGLQPTRIAPPKPANGPVVVARPQENNFNNSNANQQLPKISSPIRNSFIHAGHGGSDSALSWGDPSSIPDVYLKNPVLKPVVGTDVPNAIPINNQNHQQGGGSIIPMKPSIPTNQNNSGGNNTARSNISLASSSSGFGSGGGGNNGSITSIEEWNRARLINLSEPSSARSNNQQPQLPLLPQTQRAKSPDVTMRPQQQNQPLQPRPKTSVGLPPPISRKKPSMNEQARSEQAFSWVDKEIIKKDQELIQPNKFDNGKAIPRPTTNLSNSGAAMNNIDEHKARLNGLLNERKGTNFSIVAGESPRNLEDQRKMDNNGIRIPTGGISVMPKSPIGKYPLNSGNNASTGNLRSPGPSSPRQPMIGNGNNQISSLTLANTQLPDISSNGPDPFVVSDQLKSILHKPLFSQAITPQPQPPTLPISNPPPSMMMQMTPMQGSMATAMPSGQRTHSTQNFLEPTPLPQFLANINGSSTLPSRNASMQIVNELRNNLNSNGQNQSQQSQIQQQNRQTILMPSNNEINMPKMNNGFVLPSTALPSSSTQSSGAVANVKNSAGVTNGSLLPPPSPLLSQFLNAEAAKRGPTQPQNNGNRINTNIQAVGLPRPQQQQQQQPMPIMQQPQPMPQPMPIMQPMPMPQPTRVIPSTAPSHSQAIVNSMVHQQQQRPQIGFNTNFINNPVPPPLHSPHTLSPPRSPRNMPSAPTHDELIYGITSSNNSNAPSQRNNQNSNSDNNIALSNANELLSKVKSNVPLASDAECRAALLKHQFNTEMAIKQLKIDSLLQTALTNDHDLAASALDYCNWDLNQAAIRLMSN